MDHQIVFSTFVDGQSSGVFLVRIKPGQILDLLQSFAATAAVAGFAAGLLLEGMTLCLRRFALQMA